MEGHYVNVTDHDLTINGTEELLKAAHHHYLLTYTPIIVFMSFTTVIGLVGNVLTVLFFGLKARKTSTIVFIVAVAVLDFTVCCMACTSIAHMCVNVYFSGQYLCKTMYFFNYSTVLSSVLVLWAISIDRYRKICKPFGRQLKVKSAFISVFVLIGIALVTSVQTFITYDVVQVDMAAPDGKGRVIVNHCTNAHKPELRIVLTVIHSIGTTFTLSVFVTFFVTYSQIWYVLRTTRKRKSMAFQTSVSNEDPSSKIKSTSFLNLSNPASAESSSRNAYTSRTHGGDGLTFNDTTSQSSDTSLEVLSFPVVQTKKIQSKSLAYQASKTERNITIMMLAVTVGFVVCFTPYFIVGAIRTVTPMGEHELSAWVQILLRGPFFNSVINPIIFCFFNPQFRRYVKGAILGCKRS